MKYCIAGLRHFCINHKKLKMKGARAESKQKGPGFSKQLCVSFGEQVKVGIGGFIAYPSKMQYINILIFAKKKEKLGDIVQACESNCPAMYGHHPDFLVLYFRVRSKIRCTELSSIIPGNWTAFGLVGKRLCRLDTFKTLLH